MALISRIAATPAGWHSHGLPLRRLYTIFMVLFALFTIGTVLAYRSSPRPENDFFAFNSFSRFLHDQRPAVIYDQDLLRRFQGLPHHKLFAYMYHPGMMLLLWPLADLPYCVGYLLWIGLGLVACCIAIAGTRSGWPLALLVLVAPSTLWTGLCGQSSLLVAALLVGGLMLAPSRPIFSGMLLGLAAYKPQLGLLVPVALLAAERWKVMSSAAATGLGVVLLSTLVFGSDVWPAWFRHLPSIVAISDNHRVDWAPLQTTIGANLAMLGAGKRAGEVAQLAGCGFAVLCVWRCFRPSNAAGRCRRQEHLQIAVLGAATFLATPFAFTYDLPLLTAALLLFVSERRLCEGSFEFYEVFMLIAGLLLPCLVVTGSLQAASGTVILVLLCIILRRLHRVRTGLVPALRPLLRVQ